MLNEPRNDFVRRIVERDGSIRPAPKPRYQWQDKDGKWHSEYKPKKYCYPKGGLDRGET